MNIERPYNLDIYIKDNIIRLPFNISLENLNKIPFFKGTQVQRKKQSKQACELRNYLIYVYQSIFSDIYKKFIGNQLSFSQIKAFCCKNLLINIKDLLEKIPVLLNPVQSMENLNKIIQKIIQAQLKKYPQKIKIKGLVKIVKDVIPNTDKIGSDQYDFFQLNKIKIVHNPIQVNYFSFIMQSINKMISIPSEKISENSDFTYFSFYKEIMTAIVICSSDQLREKVQPLYKPHTQDQYIQEIGVSIIGFMEKNNAFQQVPQIGQKKHIKQLKNLLFRFYYDQLKSNEKVQEKLKNLLINTKISQKMQAYSERQINSQKLQIRDSTVLRIITKWVQQLLKIFQKPNETIYDRTQKFKTNLFKFLNLEDISKEPTQLFKSFIQIIEKFRKMYIQPFVDTIKKQNFKYQYIFGKQINEGMYLPDQLANIGAFATKLQKVTRGHMAYLLNWLIHYLTLIPVELLKSQNNNIAYKNQSRQPSKSVQPYDQILSHLNLVTFKMGDLIRGKYGGSQNQFIRFMKILQYISKQKPDFLKVIRSKNRMEQDGNDVLLNILAKEKIICEFQIYIKATSVSNEESIQKKTKQFQHLPYQFQRATFGPLSQLTVIFIKQDIQLPAYLSKQIKSINQKVYLKNQKIIQNIKSNFKHRQKKYQKEHIIEKFKENIPIFCVICHQMATITQQSREHCFRCRLTLLKSKYFKEQQKKQRQKLNLEVLNNFVKLEQSDLTNKIIAGLRIFGIKQWCLTGLQNQFQTNFCKFGYSISICRKKQLMKAFFGAEYYNKKIIYRIKSSFIRKVNSQKSQDFERKFIQAIWQIKLASFIKSKKKTQLCQQDKINISQNLNESEVIQIIYDIDTIFHIDQKKQDQQNFIFWSLQKNFQTISIEQIQKVNNLILNKPQCKFYNQFFKKRDKYQKFLESLVVNSINRKYLQKFFIKRKGNIFLNRFTQIQNWIIQQTLQKYSRQCLEVQQFISKNNAIKNFQFKLKQKRKEITQQIYYQLQEIEKQEEKLVNIKWLQKLQNIQTLDLSFNQNIQTLVIDRQKNKKLKNVIIQNTSISIDRNVMFSQKVQLIKMKSTNISPNFNVFNNKFSTKKLSYLCLNQIYIQKYFFFQNCPHLKTLHLTQSYIQNMKIFQQLVFLQELCLSKSYFIQSLEIEVQSNYSSESELQLEEDSQSIPQRRYISQNIDNKISFCPFAKNKKLRMLFLDDTNISELKSCNCLQNYQNGKLEQLNLFGTNYQLLQSTSIKNLKILNIGNRYKQNKRIKQITILQLFSNLQELHLQHRHIKNFHLLKDFPNIKILNLSHTNIETLDLANFPNIQSLNLDGCQNFTDLQATQPLFRLRNVSMTGTKINKFPSFRLFPNLTFLNLQNIKTLNLLNIEEFLIQDIYSYSNSIGLSYSLQNLNLHSSTILQINCIQHFVNLKILHLHAKFFQSKDEVMKLQKLYNLQQVFIFDQKPQITITLSFQLRNLRKLNISSVILRMNQFSSQNFKSLQYLKLQKIKFIDINPISTKQNNKKYYNHSKQQQSKNLNKFYLKQQFKMQMMPPLIVQFKHKANLSIIKIVKCNLSVFSIIIDENMSKITQLRIIQSSIINLQTKKDQKYLLMREIILIQNTSLQNIPNLMVFPFLQIFSLIKSKVKNIQIQQGYKFLKLKVFNTPLNYQLNPQLNIQKYQFAPKLKIQKIIQNDPFQLDDRKDEQFGAYKRMINKQFYFPQIDKKQQNKINFQLTYCDFSGVNERLQHGSNEIRCSGSPTLTNESRQHISSKQKIYIQQNIYQNIGQLAKELKDYKNAVILNVKNNKIRIINEYDLNQLVQPHKNLKIIDLRENPLDQKSKNIIKKYIKSNAPKLKIITS